MSYPVCDPLKGEPEWRERVRKDWQGVAVLCFVLMILTAIVALSAPSLAIALGSSVLSSIFGLGMLAIWIQDHHLLHLDDPPQETQEETAQAKLPQAKEV
jgi:hypothetical protein